MHTKQNLSVTVGTKGYKERFQYLASSCLYRNSATVLKLSGPSPALTRSTLSLSLMASSQSQTVNLTDLDLPTLQQVKVQLEEVRYREIFGCILDPIRT